MSTESFNRTSEIIETPSYVSKTPKRVDVGVLKQRLLEEKKKEKGRKTKRKRRLKGNEQL